MASGYFYLNWKYLKYDLNLPEDTEIIFVESRVENEALRILVKHPDLGYERPCLCEPTFERKNGITKFIAWNAKKED